jgi:hypothetical protein
VFRLRSIKHTWILKALHKEVPTSRHCMLKEKSNFLLKLTHDYQPFFDTIQTIKKKIFISKVDTKLKPKFRRIKFSKDVCTCNSNNCTLRN